MDEHIQIGSRVTWKARGVIRTGVVEWLWPTSSHVRVKPDTGNRHWVSRSKLTRIDDAPQASAGQGEASNGP